ncbi:hypothetical protein [Lactococcus cremoris]|uniref:hypothetical protein n=1 Tax=Lactococcus lactis subsp. cremoris TaxID=1359 RepID=UPI002FC7C157
MYYGFDEEGNLSGTVFTRLETISITGKAGEVKFGESNYNVYSDLPIVEIISTKKKQFEPVDDELIPITRNK